MCQDQTSDLIQGFTLIEFLVSASLASCLILSVVLSYSRLALSSASIFNAANVMSNTTYALYYLYAQLHHLIETDENQVSRLGLMPLKTLSDMHIKQGADVLQMVSYTHHSSIKKFIYIANDTRGESALFSKEEDKPRVKIASNIDNMLIHYGIRCEDNSHICDYLAASRVRDWRRVGSVIIRLTSSSTIKFPNNTWTLYVALP